MIDLFTHQFIARTSLLGMGIEALGVCYLAYDLLGGKHGPLRVVARAASYMALFFIGYFIVLGLRYTLVASVGMGITLGVEYYLAGKRCEQQKPSRLGISSFGFVRGIILGVASMAIVGPLFGAVFGLLSGLGLATSYWFGFAPTDDYEPDSKPTMGRHKALASGLRAAIITVAGLAAGFASSSTDHWAQLGLRLGLAAGVVSALVGLLSPVIEWQIENIPDRRLGAIGLIMIFAGMILQSIQYWATVFDIPIG